MSYITMTNHISSWPPKSDDDIIMLMSKLTKGGLYKISRMKGFIVFDLILRDKF
jgi:hypothetical protein